MTTISDEVARYIEDAGIPISTVVGHAPRFMRRHAVARLCAQYEVYKLILDVKGSVVECGIHHGAGLFTWAHLSETLEPYATHRHIVGFDTFTGFTTVNEKDAGGTENSELYAGGFQGSSLDDMKKSIAIFERHRHQNGTAKIRLIPGDATQTIPNFIEDNKHTVVALLYLDFDLYEPTKAAIESFLPRMPKGAVICFDEINHSAWPGETMALLETIGISSLRIRKFPFERDLAYAVIE